MEATLLGVPAIALSLHYTNGAKEHWETPEAMAPAIIRKLIAAGWPKNVMINVNFPDRAPDEVQGFSIAKQGRRKLGDQLGERVDMRGEHYYWIGPLREEAASREGTDIWAVNEGRVAITPLDLDLTHDPTSVALAGVFP
jgi:5'-nucleotidase